MPRRAELPAMGRFPALQPLRWCQVHPTPIITFHGAQSIQIHAEISEQQPPRRINRCIRRS
ncbi:MAG TPA: hypothetical protein VGS41_03360, partial [Chthonomonadales bacterium]|nr:hypothetical protein [Chthonomonadales bacterium]